MTKKIISILLVLVMTAAALSGCGGTDKGGSGTVTTAAASAETAETTTAELRPDLPDTKFDGADFGIFYSNNAEYGGTKNDFFAEELNGELINDARFDRNRMIEEAFDIKLFTEDLPGTSATAATTKMRTMVMSGDDTFDLMLSCGYTTCDLAADGLLYDLYEIPWLELGNPWWDQKANEHLTVMGHMFYTTGDISTADNEATYCIMFNKNMFEDYQLDNPYDLVSGGIWTIDKWIEMIAGVAEDLDGNGKFDSNDRYGAMLWDDTMMGVVNATGEKCCTVNSDGEIELTLYSDKTVSIIEKYFSVALDKSQTYTYQRYNWDDKLLGSMFKNNQSLFILQLLQMVPKLRDMEADFGIIPYWKADEKQDEYYNTVGSWHSVFMAVPLVQKDIERTGMVAELFAFEGMNLLTPAYYDLTLKTKAARDEESSEMLDIIFRTRVFDLGWYYAIGGYNEQVMSLLRQFKSDFTSMYNSYENKALDRIKQLNENFAEIGK